jgi:phosphoribosyl-dephospho-CoA transferase
LEQKQRKLNIEIGEKESEGIYSNLAMIAHSPQEIIIDFARVMPGAVKTKVLSRIIMTPAHAKMLSKALEENLKKFETQYGQIKIQGGEIQGGADKNIGFQAAK